MRANMRLEHQLLAVETEHRVHAMLELVAPPAPATERRPLSLALVLDRSGSMAGPKLEVARECASFLARRLEPTDRLAIVTFDDEVQLLRGLLPVDTPALLAAIAAITDGGSTNLSGGWLKGMEALRTAPDDGPRRVLLLTDGQANVGIMDSPSLVAMARQASEQGVSTTTIGFGDDFDEELLTEMADAGRGTGHYASTPDEAPKIFASEFEGLASVVAQNVSVEIRPGGDVEMLGILNAYPMVEVAGGVQVQLGDAYGDERRRVVFELRVPSVPALGVATVAEVVVRHVSVGDQVELHETTIPVTVNLVSADEAAAAGADAEVTDEVVVLKTAKAQEEAREHADRGDYDAARTTLAAAAEDLKRIAPASPRAAELTGLADQLESHGDMMAPQSYGPGVRKSMRYGSHGIRRSRPRP